MRAALVTALDGPRSIEVTDVPEPVAAPGQVLVDVDVAGVVFPDVLMTRGLYQSKPELPYTPGWDVSGTLREECHGLPAGTRVAAMPIVGGFAETVAVDVSRVYALPEGVTPEVAAALPLNYLTAHFALVHRARLRDGDTVLVHGAAGGVGSAACGLAAAYGARVIAVVSSPDRAEVARAAGAHETVTADGFLEQTRGLTGGRGVDVVVDPVGGDRMTDSLRSLAPEGRVVVLGFTAGEIPTVRVNRLLLTNTTVIGAALLEFWRTDPTLGQRQWHDLVPLVGLGALTPPIARVLPLEEAAEAVATLDERRAVGRVLVRVR
ncbi:NADPH:quinone oxidoreductase family protein [Agilicoccus flavus]|uniref:NADPH:quinone oxidoreductase family protein n=1 Tax=Agilicoccus flavus TaxID=2775968 RepID=UPI001CF64BC6|nr:NADPH:quinone oxidoreductase family protein [Agilicoccus flavus]